MTKESAAERAATIGANSNSRVGMFAMIGTVVAALIGAIALVLSSSSGEPPRQPANTTIDTMGEDSPVTHGNDSPIITVENSEDTRIEIGKTESERERVSRMIVELSQILHDRANAAFKPISCAFNDDEFADTDVTMFKEQWVNLELDLNKALLDHHYALVCDLGNALKQHGSSEYAATIGKKCGSTPTGILFSPLPDGLVAKLRLDLPELNAFIDIFGN